MRLRAPLRSLRIASTTLALTLVTSTLTVASPTFDSAAWGRVLERFQHEGGLDYAALKSARQDLDAYTSSLGAARPEEGSRSQQMAFWINAYNAVVAHFVLELYPEVESVKDVAGFFDRRRFPVAGEELTLDEIEQRALALDEPRVHFAVVCASTSCPDLRAEPYEADRLEEQLAEQTASFLADSSKGLRFERGDNVVWLSSIFKWYADDFTGGSRIVAFFARGRVLDWVVDHLPQDRGGELAASEPAVRYLDYDWSLNDRSLD